MTTYRSLNFMQTKKQYRVGKDGSVWSWIGGRGSDKFKGWRKLKPKINNKKPYHRVGISLTNGRRLFLVHHLVLLAFVGPCPKGEYGCHEDDNPENNNLKNLRWGTPQSNWEDRFKNGNSNHGETNVNAKLKNEEVSWLRQKYATNHGLSCRAFSYKFSDFFEVASITIRKIVSRRERKNG